MVIFMVDKIYFLYIFSYNLCHFLLFYLYLENKSDYLKQMINYKVSFSL